MTLAELVDRAIGLVFDEQLQPHEAAEKALASWELDETGIDEAVRVGVTRIINQKLDRFRSGKADGEAESELPTGARSGRFQHRTHRHEGAYYHLSQPFRSADGRMLPLLDFTTEDWQAMDSDAASKLAGWQATKSLTELALRWVTKRTRDLSASRLAQLEAAAAQAFRTVAV